MKNIKRFIPMFLSVLLILTTVGCRKNDGFNWSQLSGDKVQKESEAPVAESVFSGDLTVSMPRASGKLDPLTNPSMSMQGLMRLCFEGVMRLDEHYQPAKWLAESVEKTEDGYHITLRQGVRFHDGAGLTASAVVRSFRAIRDAESSPWKSVIQPIREMTAEGERELKVVSADGYAALYALTFPIVSEQEENQYPAGTGPYSVTAYVEGQTMDLTRYEGWWRIPAQIPAIHAIARQDAESVLNTFLTGILDVCTVDMLTVSSVASRGGVKKQDYLTGQAELLLPNFNGIMGDARMRAILAQAIDRQDIISNTYQNHGVAVDVPVLPDSWLAELANVVEYDPAAAREQLEQLGWIDIDGDGYLEREKIVAPEDLDEQNSQAPMDPEKAEEHPLAGILSEDELKPAQQTGERLKLRILTNEEDPSSHKEVAARLVNQLKEIGIEVTVTAVSFDKLKKTVEDGEFDLLLTAYQLPDNGNLASLLQTNGANNLVSYSDAEMDAALEQLRVADTEEVYYAAMQHVYELIVRDLPVYTLCMRTSTQVCCAQVTVPGIVRADEPYMGIENWTKIGKE